MRDFSKIPQEMRDLPQWVLSNPTGVPVQPCGDAASSTDEKTWSAFDEVVDAFQSKPDGWQIGFVFTDNDLYVGIDLDDCVVDGKLTARAKEIIKSLNSYSELSRSKKGVHVIVKGSIPGERRKESELGVEMYSSGRVFATTGYRIPRTEKEVMVRQAEIAKLYHETFPKKKPEPRPQIQTDDTLWERMFSSPTNGAKIRALFDGQWEGRYGSQSEADSALCFHLAFWTDKDRLMMDAMFRQSALFSTGKGRPKKWDSGGRGGDASYGSGTIDRAIANTGETISSLTVQKRVSEAIDNEPLDKETIEFLLRAGANDFGNAECVKLLHGNKIIYSDIDKWMSYDNQAGYWSSEGGDIMANRAVSDTLRVRRQVARKAGNEVVEKATAHMNKNKNSIVSSFKDIAFVKQSQFVNDPNLLNTMSGVMDLRSGQLLTHDPSQYFTSCSPVLYDPKASDEMWLKFISESVGDYDEVKEWLQMSLGYSISGNTSEDCMWYKHGPPRSGKGTMDRVMISLLGKPMAKGVPFSTFTRNRGDGDQGFDIADLWNTRYVAASESNRGEKMNEGFIKMAMGGDEMMAARKGQQGRHFYPVWHVWTSSNHPARGDSDDDALWGRIRVVSFPKSNAANPDKSLRDEITRPSVLSGVFNYLIKGFSMWHESPNGLVTPKSVSAKTAGQREEGDSVGEWIKDCCDTEESLVQSGKWNDDSRDSLFITNKDLLESYKEWCADEGYNPKQTVTSILSSLELKGFQVRKQKRVYGKPTKVTLGLRIKPVSMSIGVEV